jgi:hypothetical protein
LTGTSLPPEVPGNSSSSTATAGLAAACAFTPAALSREAALALDWVFM